MLQAELILLMKLYYSLNLGIAVGSQSLLRNKTWFIQVVLYVRLTGQYFFYKYCKCLKRKIKRPQLAFMKTNQLKYTNKNP